MSGTSYSRSLGTLISVFFFWGFLAASNGVFIPFCKTHFSLNQFQSQLVDTAFYGAYFFGSLFLYIISLTTGRDVLNRIGYKKSIVVGLLISIAGALTMIAAVESTSFPFILGAFFIIALGFSLQQTAANPFTIALGNPEKGSHRLTLAGGVNSFGTTIGPLIISIILFGSAVAGNEEKANASIGSINILYIFLSVAFAVAALIFSLAKMPKLSIEDETTDKTSVLKAPLQIIIFILFGIIVFFAHAAINKAGGEFSQFLFLLIISLFCFILFLFLLNRYIILKKQNRFETKSFPQLQWGMLAIFIYVGVEVSIQSNMGALLKTADFGGLDESKISRYISLFWGSLMIGRWTGAIAVFDLHKKWRRILTVVIPFLGFITILFVNFISGNYVLDLLVYSVCILVLITGFFFSQEKPAKTMMTFGVLGVLAMLTGLFTKGTVATYALISGGLFCSIMWPCIFALSIAGLKQYTSQASGFLIMMILGGAFIPPVQGLICDMDKEFSTGIAGTTWTHFSYIIPVACFAYLAFYAWKSKRILKSQGIDYDDAIARGH